jgi:hypothetical protein
VDVIVTTYGGTSATSSADHFVYSNASNPSVTGLDVTTGVASGGTTVTILGSNFTGADGVSFGSVAASSFTVVSDNAVLATAPPQAAATVDVKVTTYAGTSSTSSADQFTYTPDPAPTITSLNPSTGGSGGGTTVTITGTNFSNATGVSFGSVAASSFLIVSPTVISAVAPPLSAGTIDVSVSTPGGTSALNSADRFVVSASAAPAVSGLGTTSGTTAGGTSVAITGSGFTGASAVSFGGVAATFTFNSDTSITAIAPPEAAGTVDVIVATPTGTSAAVAADQFTYTAATAPSVTGLSSTGGSTAGGPTINVYGSNFTGATGVTFGSVAASFTVQSDGWITAVAPSQAAATVDVKVTTYAGTSAAVSADHYTYTAAAAPTVTVVTPATGNTAGGPLVTVLGTGFTGSTAVKFGTATASSFTVLSDTALTVNAPAGSAGTVDVTVTTPSGTSSTGSADHYSYSSGSAPSVTGVSPSSGGTGGGTVVVVSGSGFTGATGVSFGSYAATFTVNSDTQLTAIAPAQAAATVDVQVTTAFGTSSAVAADHFTFNAATGPSVTGVGPSAGPTTGGTQVTVSGSHFTGATQVLFGTTAAVSFRVASDATIFAVAPAESAAVVDVTVTTPSGTSSTSSADQFTFHTPQAINTPPNPNVTFTAGVPRTGTVVSFTSQDGSDTASSFTAVINWGDGSSSIGQVTAGSSTFLVGGTHTYGAAGNYTIAVQITDVWGSTAVATALANAGVNGGGNAPTRPGPRGTGTHATATHGAPFKGSLGSFLDALGGAAGTYKASINWGDGHTSAGVVQAAPGGAYTVVGGHTFAAAGTYIVAIMVTDGAGNSTTFDATILVADAREAPPEEVPDRGDGDPLPSRAALVSLVRAEEETDAALLDQEGDDDADWFAALTAGLKDSLPDGQPALSLNAVWSWAGALRVRRGEDAVSPASSQEAAASPDARAERPPADVDGHVVFVSDDAGRQEGDGERPASVLTQAEAQKPTVKDAVFVELTAARDQGFRNQGGETGSGLGKLAALSAELLNELFANL